MYHSLKSNVSFSQMIVVINESHSFFILRLFLNGLPKVSVDFSSSRRTCKHSNYINFLSAMSRHQCILCEQAESAGVSMSHRQ